MICITTTESNLDSPVSPVFGRCQYFLFVDEKGKLVKNIPNAGIGAFRGAGIAAAQTVVSEKVEAVITGNVGPNAFDVLSASGIKIFSGFGQTAKEALKMYQEGKLTETAFSAGRGGFGGGAGRGAGRGRRI